MWGSCQCALELTPWLIGEHGGGVCPLFVFPYCLSLYSFFFSFASRSVSLSASEFHGFLFDFYSLAGLNFNEPLSQLFPAIRLKHDFHTQARLPSHFIKKLSKS